LRSGPQINGQTEQFYQGEELTDQMSVDALFELMFSGSAGFNWQSDLFREDGAEMAAF